MNVQYDLFDSVDEISKHRREVLEKIEILASGKHMRGLKGKEMWEKHVKKIEELFEEESY